LHVVEEGSTGSEDDLMIGTDLNHAMTMRSIITDSLEEAGLDITEAFGWQAKDGCGVSELLDDE
jgi:hypothetical protein